jgi:hypothetical protein
MSVLGVTKIRFFAEPCPDLAKKQGTERFSTDFKSYQQFSKKESKFFCRSVLEINFANTKKQN